jgi:hypothetical protein
VPFSGKGPPVLMPKDQSGQVTELLHHWKQGGEKALGALVAPRLQGAAAAGAQPPAIRTPGSHPAEQAVARGSEQRQVVGGSDGGETCPRGRMRGSRRNRAATAIEGSKSLMPSGEICCGGLKEKPGTRIISL